MSTAAFDKYTHILPPLKISLLKGGSAGNFTLTGIATVDSILSVSKVVLSATELSTAIFNSVADLTSEFSISAANTINNTSGSDSTGALLLVLWADYDRSS